ncbi:MAG: DUF692 family protein, partial [Candidatus Adiutrix sp.]|nr:DUF692 family protein [Candidatus Adiutrix sp.]
HTADAVGFIRRFYRGPLAAENYNYYPTGLYNQVTEPAFIADYLREFDLGLALDLAHGAVTAANLGERPESYFAALPLARTAELHLSRPFLPAPGSGLMAADAHGAPGAREWNWLAFVIGNKEFPAAVPVFVEYYRDLDKLEEMQKRLAVFLTAPGAAGA